MTARELEEYARKRINEKLMYSNTTDTEISYVLKQIEEEMGIAIEWKVEGDGKLNIHLCVPENRVETTLLKVNKIYNFKVGHPVYILSDGSYSCDLPEGEIELIQSVGIALSENEVALNWWHTSEEVRANVRINKLKKEDRTPLII